MSVGARSHTAFFRPFKLIGLGFWQAWWMCAMCSPAVLPLDAAIVGLDARFAIQIATDVGYLAIIVASLSGKISNLRAMHGALPFAAGSFSLGTFMLMLAPYLTDASLCLVVNASACVCVLFGNALLLLLWGELWSTLATGRVGRHLYLSYLFAFVLFFLAHLLPHPLDGLLVCTFPLASALIYATCMHEPRRTSNRRPIPLKSLPIASFLGMTVLVSIIYGASQHGIPSAYGFGEAVSLNPASMLVAGTCLAAFVLNLVITNPESEALQLFRNVIPVMAAGLALTLLLPPDYAFAGNGLIILGIYSLDMLLMLVSTDVSFRTGIPVAQTFGVAILSSRIGTLLGTSATIALAASGLWNASVLRSSLIVSLFLLVIAGMLIFNQADLEKVYRWMPGQDDRPFEEQLAKMLDRKCADVADAYGLTAREREVLVLLAHGRTVPEVCEELSIARGTAKHHVSNIYRKVGVYDRRSLLDVVGTIG